MVEERVLKDYVDRCEGKSQGASCTLFSCGRDS